MSAPFYQPGRYLCRITGQGLGETSTGNSQIVLRFTVLECENGESVGAQYDRTIYRVLTENTLPYVVKDLATLGFSGLSEIDPASDNHRSIIDTDYVFACAHEKGQDGLPREKWMVPFAAGEFEIKKPLDAKGRRSLEALFGKQIKDGLAGLKPVAPQAAPVKREPALVSQPRTRAAVIDDGPPPSAPITDDEDSLPF